MIKRSVLAGLAVCALGFALPAQAADPAVGQKLFEATCVACHGPDGISLIPMYPDLAGQKSEYVVTSLKAYRDGKRVDDAMSPQAAGLSDTDIANIAVYVSSLRRAGGAEAQEDAADAPDPADVAAGQKLYDASCVACHGRKGISVAPVYPNLNGQKEQYLVKELTAYRDGDRKDGIMTPMARHLSDADIARISAYLSTVRD